MLRFLHLVIETAILLVKFLPLDYWGGYQYSNNHTSGAYYAVE